MKFQKTKHKYSHQENDQILKEWEQKSKRNGHGEIESDGVAYKGEINSFDPYNERQPGDEEEIWNNSDKRILFIAKELNNPGNPYDSRVVVCYDPSNNIIPTDRFLKSMLFITSGLLHSSETKSAEFDKHAPMDKIMADWDSAAVAKINVKKQPGGSASNFSQICQAMEDYKDYLIRQIKLLNANIIVCCDASGLILHTIKQWVYPDAEQVNDYVWYDKATETLLINSYHLSARTSYQRKYDHVISNYVDALAKLN